MIITKEWVGVQLHPVMTMAPTEHVITVSFYGSASFHIESFPFLWD